MLLPALVLVGAGCGVSRWSGEFRPAVATPRMFYPDVAVQDSAACPAVLIDSTSLVRLHLVRSRAFQDPDAIMILGDYQPGRAGAYDESSGELLRVECIARAAVGIVKR